MLNQQLGGDIVMWNFKVCFLYTIPILMHLLFLPFWLIKKNFANISLIELIMGAVIVPLYLLIVSIKFIDIVNVNKRWTLISMIIIIFVSDFINYFNWGVSTGNFFHPDSETILIIKYEVFFSVVFIILGWTIFCFIKKHLM